jgi:N,N'-diacetyllegionaminate synthase
MRVEIDGRPVGGGQPCYVIAEAGVNHNGSVAIARQLIDAAVEAGADAVKFQSFDAEELVTAAAEKAAYQVATTGGGSQLQMLQQLQLDAGIFADLRDYSRDCGIAFLSSPFDAGSADMLAELGVPAFKIASGEITNLDLLRHVSALGRPIILSTGMAWMTEVETAVQAMREAGAPSFALLHCLSAYPAPPAEVNLRAIDTLREAFACPVGLSDHTQGTAVGIAAVARGAAIVEKHLTVDRTLPGPDHQASLEPRAFRDFVAAIREVEAALGDGEKRPAASERAVAIAARRSLVTACAIAAGEQITDAMIVARRPGTGLPPSARSELLGLRARIDLAAGTVLQRGMIG